ncbi:MAG TPA: CBS domain-containing protein [Pseudomonadales bacterium]
MADSVLLAAFAAQEPERFAALLAERSAEERLDVFTRLAPEAAAAVAARLPRSELANLPRAMLVRWIETGGFDDAASLLGKLSRHDALAHIELVSDANRRRRLQQFFVFPSHSLGSITSADFVQVPERATVREVLRVLAEQKDGPEPPVVVVAGNGRLLDALDLWRLLLRVEFGGIARDCLKPVPRLRPEVSIESAVELPAWKEHHWLPVTDPEQRLLGVVSRARLFAAHEPQREAVPIGEGIVELGSQFVAVSADMLGELIGRDER